MNKMKEVANLLGVELDEEFYIKDAVSTFKITEAGLGIKVPDDNKFRTPLTGMLFSLLLGESIIEKVKEGDK